MRPKRMESTAANALRGSRTVPKRVVAFICGAFLLLAVLIAAIQMVWARHHLLAGAANLNAAITTVKSPAELENPVARNRAIRDLRLARSDFARARSDLAVLAPVLASLDGLPRYGSVLAAAAPASASAYFATSSALDIVGGAHRLWPALNHHRRPLLVRLASALRGSSTDFAQAQSDAAQGISSLIGVPAKLSYQGLQSDIAKLRRDLPRLRAAAAWLQLMPTILGQAGRQRYLFCWENSTEIRPSGGFLGAVDLVSLRHGAMTKRFSGSAIEAYRRPVVRLPIPEAVTTLETNWIFRDSNVSPNFPLSARLERWFYQKDTGVAASGVVDFVDQGVPDLLSATGPIYLKQYHLAVNSHNAVALANRFASVNPVPYRGPRPPGTAGNLDTYRKQFLGFEFAAILHRLQSLPASRWAALGRAMELAIQRKDILIWSPNPKVEHAITLSGADGSIHHAPGDFLYVVDDNRSYNKIGPYVHESARYEADLVQGGWVDSTLTLKYHLDPSPDWVEGFGPGLGALGNKHQFRDFVRVLVPPGAVVQPVPGLDQALPLGFVGRSEAGLSAYGLTQISGWFTMNPGQTKTIRISYEVPANDFSFDHFRRYQLTVVRQPGTRLGGISVRIQAVGGVRLEHAAGRLMSFYRTWLPLTGDRSLSLRTQGVGQPNLVVSPPVNGSDPLIPTKYLPGLY